MSETQRNVGMTERDSPILVLEDNESLDTGCSRMETSEVSPKATPAPAAARVGHTVLAIDFVTARVLNTKTAMLKVDIRSVKAVTTMWDTLFLQFLNR